MNYDDALRQLIANAMMEDVGEGDHSTLASIDPSAKGKAILKVKQQGIIAGINVARKIFSFTEPEIIFHAHIQDGQPVAYGDIVFEVEGKVHTILQCERLVLNTMQRMTGIATLTNKYVQKLAAYHTQLLDTRKTTPNFRLLEKEAVRIGGGVNHRFGLYDMIMLKDNHIDYCGGMEAAILKAHAYILSTKSLLKMEVETRNIEDVKKVMAVGKIDRIMLDNFTPEQIKEALQLINKKYETEASGGINFENLEEYAATGVDYISSGAIIHQAVSIDLSLKAVII